MNLELACRRWPATLLLAAAVCIAAIAPGCLKKPAPEPRQVSIAFQQWVGYGLFYLAQDKGFCHQESIELLFVNEELDSAREEALMEGMLDCEAATLDLLVSKAIHGTRVVMVMELDHSCGSDGIVAAENIKTIQDLEHKKVTLARNNVGEHFLAYLMQSQGLSLTNITVVPALPDEAADVFLAGKAEACATWEPHLSEALRRPGAHLLASTREHPGAIIDVMNVRKDLVDNEPELVKKIMRAWFKALDYFRNNPEEAAAIIAPRFKITARQYLEQVKGLKWTGRQEQLSPESMHNQMRIFDCIARHKTERDSSAKKPEAAHFLNRALLETLDETGQ
ncbi:MAG: ABC transporter substrate-binding protein [Kiritimatiellia bacterium]